MLMIIELDSSEVVQLINGFSEQDHPFLQLILKCKKLHRRLWTCSITYVPQNYNNSAYCIVKLGHIACSHQGTVWFVNPPSSVLEEVMKDRIM